MRKAELVAFAKENNIEIDEKATNAVMIETIEAALSKPVKERIFKILYTARRCLVMASKKGVGSSKNGRDSESKRLGVKTGTVSSSAREAFS